MSSISFQDEILQQFQDLLETEKDLLHRYNEDNIENHHYDPNEYEKDIPVLSAYTLNNAEVMNEMERLGLHPKGFFEDDCKVLQEALNKEHQDYMNSKEKERQMAQEKRRGLAQTQRIDYLQKSILEEEDNELMVNDRLKDWVELIQTKNAPCVMRFHLNHISSRIVSRLLWSDNCIHTFDVTNCKLTDKSGVYIARMLKNNTALKKMELRDNYFGHETCAVLEESLKTNQSLKYLGLDSNPLTSSNSNEAIESLANIIQYNKSIEYLSIHRCNIGVGGGRSFSKSIVSNDTIICIDFSLNYWEIEDIAPIQQKLNENQRKHQERKREEEIQREQEHLAAERAHQQSMTMHKEENDRQWLEDEKRNRANERLEHVFKQLTIEKNHRKENELMGRNHEQQNVLKTNSSRMTNKSNKKANANHKSKTRKIRTN